MAKRTKHFTTLAAIMLVVFILLLWEHFADGSSNAPAPNSIKIADNEIANYFSPYGGCTDAIVDEIDNAQKTIDVGIYTFTSRPISQAIVRAYERGVQMRVIMDRNQAAERFSKKRYIVKKGIPVELNTGDGIMHNKFAVIDSSIVITGSFNWTNSAERYNYENIIIVNSLEFAMRYEKYFAKMWKRFE